MPFFHPFLSSPVSDPSFTLQRPSLKLYTFIYSSSLNSLPGLLDATKKSKTAPICFVIFFKKHFIRTADYRLSADGTQNATLATLSESTHTALSSSFLIGGLSNFAACTSLAAFHPIFGVSTTAQRRYLPYSVVSNTFLCAPWSSQVCIVATTNSVHASSRAKDITVPSTYVPCPSDFYSTRYSVNVFSSSTAIPFLGFKFSSSSSPKPQLSFHPATQCLR